MLPALQSYLEWLSSDPLYVDEMIDKIGLIIEDYGPNVLIKPSDPLFATADIVRSSGSTPSGPSNTPAHIILKLAEPLALDSLIQAFGEYQKLPNRRPFPPRVIFYMDLPGYPYTVALIAEVGEGKATKITLRRDKRFSSGNPQSNS